jgi:hypothetical protein
MSCACSFPLTAPPRTGWRRDFVLMGDGWEKDGDYNTGYSSTVLPLPTHASTAYEASSASLELEDDPVYHSIAMTGLASTLVTYHPIGS